MHQRIPKQLLSYLILKEMNQKPKYGYQIIKKLKKLSNNHWDPSPGTIYGAINRLKKEEYIKRANKQHEDRKYYTLTKKGQKQLKKRKKQTKNTKNQSQQKILGFLNIYKQIHGQQNLQQLLKKIQKEFNNQKQ